MEGGRGKGWRMGAGDTIARGVVDIAFTVTVVMYTEHRVTQLFTGRGGAGDGGRRVMVSVMHVDEVKGDDVVMKGGNESREPYTWDAASER